MRTVYAAALWIGSALLTTATYAQTPISDQDAQEIARDAYVYVSIGAEH